MSENNYNECEQTILAIRGSLERWQKFQEDKRRYDKTGLGINLDNRFTFAKVTLSLDSWVGVYGNSSCSSFFSVGDKAIFEHAFIAVLRKNLLTLLAETADLIEHESEAAKQQEINRLKERLATLTQVKL